MKLQQTAIFLSASSYSFEDDKTKRLVEGTTVHYILAEDLAPIEDAERNSRGYKPVKGSFPVAAYVKAVSVPGIYTLDIEIEAGADGKIKAVPRDFEFVTELG